MIIKVKVKPGSSRNEIRSLSENNYEIRVTEIPEKGRANEKVIELLSGYLGIPKSKIRIIRGHAGRIKDIEIGG